MFHVTKYIEKVPLHFYNFVLMVSAY